MPMPGEGVKVASLAVSRLTALCGAAMNPLYEQMQTSVFERMSALAAKHGAVNLGQGFPDFGWPDADPRRRGARAQGRVEPICAVARAARRCAKRSRRITAAITG